MTWDQDRELGETGMLLWVLAYFGIFTIIAVYSLRIMGLAVAALPPVMGAGIVGVPNLQIVFCTQVPNAPDDCKSLATAVRVNTGLVAASISDE